jgi:hypothetical protein
VNTPLGYVVQVVGAPDTGPSGDPVRWWSGAGPGSPPRSRSSSSGAGRWRSPPSWLSSSPPGV